MAASACVSSAACRGDTAPVEGALIDTLSSGVIRVWNPASDSANLRTTELLRIGEIDAGEAYVFGRVVGIALSGEGTIYVLDSQSRELRIFHASGEHLRTVGGVGAGPAEFRDPRGMTWSPDGTLWVMDYGNQRYTVLSPDGNVIATHPRRVQARGTRWEGRFDSAGRLYDSGSVKDTAGMRLAYMRHELRAGTLVQTDTFPLPPAVNEDFVVMLRSGILSIPVPFWPRPSWAFDGHDGLWIGEADANYRIVKRSLAGDTLVVVELDRRPALVTNDELAKARSDIEMMLRRAGANANGIDFSRIPARKPVYGRLVVDDQNRLWVARVPNEQPGGVPKAAVFDVFSEAGRHLGAVTLGVLANLPLAFSNDLAAGVSRDALGAEEVVVYRLHF